MKKVALTAKDDMGYLWELDYWLEDDGFLPDGGVILSDVKHGGYNLAKEIRVIGFWIDFEIFTKGKSTKKESKFFPLKKTHFSHGVPTILKESKASVSKKAYDLYKKHGNNVFNKITPEEKQDYGTYLDIITGLQNFSVYNYITGIQAEYTLLSDFDAENCEYKNLTIAQTYLFTDYKKTPAHEPSGALAAARLFPLIKTNFITNTAFNKNAETRTQINSIRIDYRFQPRLDAFLFFEENKKALDGVVNQAAIKINDIAKNPLRAKDTDFILKTKPQQAGVFIDEESVDYLSGFFSGLAAEQAVFKAIEKPLIYEIGGVGLAKGLPFFRDSKQSYKTWDNIHWWGGYKNFHIPSAPGAFHAMHLHWRWGGAVKGGLIPPNPKHGKEKQFTESGVPSEALKDKRYKGFLGPLVDPKAWIQSVRFAIVKYNKQEDNNITTKEFRDKFSNKINIPSTNLKQINDGDSLVLWYSVELSRELTLPEYTDEDISRMPGNTRVKIPEKKLTASLSGTIFIHGLFFAHEEEEKNMLTGSIKEEYFPKGKSTILKERKFIRDAKF